MRASGYGDARANGAYTEIGTWNGQPLYGNAGGCTLGRDVMNVNWWLMSADPRNAMWETLYSRNDPSVAGPYTVWNGAAPAGTVS